MEDNGGENLRGPKIVAATAEYERKNIRFLLNRSFLGHADSAEGQPLHQRVVICLLQDE